MPPTAAKKTVKQIIQDSLGDLTRSEQQLAHVLLQDYPMAGLQSVTKFALAAGVSTPTVIRMARKLGFDGFPHLQEALRDEVAAQIKKPISKHEDWQAQDADRHPLNRFADSVAENIHYTLERLDRTQFDAVVDLLAAPERRVYVAGGRITRSNADYLFNHLQIIRPNVTQLGSFENVWPQYLLDMDENAILILFDIRRYESSILRLATLAHERGCKIVLFTDQWGSPVTKVADFVFHALVEVPSSWDSTVAIMVVLEALIAEVQRSQWEQSRKRIEDLDAMFSETRLFRSFE
ncbi:MurR/RpiR family transcriptional regulator [Pseudoruegeria sp. M32A2M]|nr:MurR/RpiR family transcriptional regulator [Aliiruegeria sabulilitoris]NDR56173.1 MurR/RpiR family transcriptional regulator [Pseudoruegeria sp. M32A2M]